MMTTKLASVLTFLLIITCINGQEQERSQNIEHNIDELIKYVNEGQMKVEIADNKTVIFFIGSTGSGKSTAISYLMGAQLTRKKLGGKFVIDIQDDAQKSEYPKIGHTFESETFYPQIYPINDDMQLCDCPGFFDTKSENERIAVSVNFEAALRKAKEIKIAIIINGAELLAQKGKSMKELVSLLGKLFVNPKLAASSALWMITRYEDFEPEDFTTELFGEHGIIKALEKNLDNLQRGKISMENDHDDDLTSDISNQIEILKSIEKDKVIIINYLEMSKKRDILNKFKNSVSLSIKDFYFETFDANRVKFESQLTLIIHNAVIDFKQEISMIKEIQEIKKKLDNGNSYLGNLTTLLVQNKAKAKEYFTKRKSELEERIEENLVFLDELTDEIDSLQYESRLLNTDELISVYKRIYNRGRVFMGYCREKFEYNNPNQPYFKSIENLNTGYLQKDRGYVDNGNQGHYLAYYSSNWWGPCDFYIELLAQKKNLYQNKLRLKEIDDEIQRKKETKKTTRLENLKIKKEIENIMDEKIAHENLESEIKLTKETISSLEISLAQLEKNLQQLRSIIDAKLHFYHSMSKLTQILPYLTKIQKKEDFKILIEKRLNITNSVEKKTELEIPQKQEIKLSNTEL